MTSLPELILSAAYAAGSPAAADKVSAAQLDVDHRAIATWINDRLLPKLAEIIRDDDTLEDRIIRSRHLHREVLVSLTGLDFLEAAAVATTAPILLTGLQAIDGYTTVAGDRVLVRAQASGVANGIYVAAVGAWSRATDADDEFEDNQVVAVENGSTYGATWWRVTDTAEVGSDDVAFLRIHTERIDTARLADGSVTTPKIADEAVTADKIADQLTSEVVKSAIQLATQGFRADVRDALTSFPVPCIRPTTTDKVIALDVCPNGSPSDFSNNGVAWIDVCDSDVQAGDPPVVALRLGISSTDLEIGIRAFNGATKKPLRIKNDAVTVMEFEIAGDINTGFDKNGAVQFTHKNPNAGTGSYAEYRVEADNAAKGLVLRKYSAAFSADSSNYADRAELLADGCALMIGGDAVYFTAGYPYSTKRVGAYDSNGNWTIGPTPVFAAYHTIGRGTAEGDTILLFESCALVYRVGNFSYNAGATAMKIGRNTATLRSVNAAGTINASGADYAEYMRKADGCGPIAKGALCGVNAAGELTDRFDDAHSFVVKSTDPSYVGGDTWGADLEGDALEAERAHWDRIAFSGRVPCNVAGATPGQYVVPRRTVSGGIDALLVTSPSFDEYRQAVGRVWSVADEVTTIAVKVA